jgi:hypothetical protein
LACRPRDVDDPWAHISGLRRTLCFSSDRGAGAILLTGYLGGAVASHARHGDPLFTHDLFGVYLGLFVWGGLWFRDARIRSLIPFGKYSIRHGQGRFESSRPFQGDL